MPSAKATILAFFERRLRELGGLKKDDGSETARAIAYNSDPNLTDAEKLLRATAGAPNPKSILQPLIDFGDAIKEDLLTKDLVQLFAKDEMGSATWIYETCAMMNGKGICSSECLASQAIGSIVSECGGRLLTLWRFDTFIKLLYTS